MKMGRCRGESRRRSIRNEPVPLGLIIVGVWWDSFQWVIQGLEVLAVIAVVLGLGSAIAVGAFWLLNRLAAKLAGPPSSEPPPGECEMELGLPDKPERDENRSGHTRML